MTSPVFSRRSNLIRNCMHPQSHHLITLELMRMVPTNSRLEQPAHALWFASTGFWEITPEKVGLAEITAFTKRKTVSLLFGIPPRRSRI